MSIGSKVWYVWLVLENIGFQKTYFVELSSHKNIFFEAQIVLTLAFAVIQMDGNFFINAAFTNKQTKQKTKKNRGK